MPPSTGHEWLLNDLMSMTLELRKLVESMPRCIEAVLARGAQCPVKTLYVGVSFILAAT